MLEIYIDVQSSPQLGDIVVSLFCFVISLFYLPGSKCAVLGSNGFGSGMDGCWIVFKCDGVNTLQK